MKIIVAAVITLIVAIPAYILFVGLTDGVKNAKFRMVVKITVGGLIALLMLQFFISVASSKKGLGVETGDINPWELTR